MSYDSTVLADSPTIYYKLDEALGTTAVDSSGNGKDGTYVGPVTFQQPSLILSEPAGYSTLFDNSGDTPGQYVNTPNFNPAAAITLEMWLKLDDDPLTGTVWNYWAESGYNVSRFGVTVTGKLYNYSVSDNITTTVFTDGSTHYLAVTYDGTYVRGYVDGYMEVELLGAHTYTTGSFLTFNFPNSWGAEYAIKGYMQKLAVYNGAALGADRILAHWNAANPSTVISPMPCFRPT